MSLFVQLAVFLSFLCGNGEQTRVSVKVFSKDPVPEFYFLTQDPSAEGIFF